MPVQQSHLLQGVIRAANKERSLHLASAPGEWGTRSMRPGSIGSLLRFAEPRERQEHTHLLAIGPILLAMEAHQISLFELQGNEDVRGCCRGEEEVPEGHRRG